MNDTQNEYDGFKQRQRRLLTLLQSCVGTLDRLQVNDWRENLTKLVDRVKSDCFKIIVLGEFKRGKSTFINALLGCEVLPAYAVPCTAVINEIKWGEEKKAILYFRNPLPNPLPATLPKDALLHIQNSNGGPAPMSVDVSHLEEYVVIPDPGKDQAESVAETPYDHVEVCWPLEICKNGVEIIDSPGLNEHGVRQKITLDYLSNVDAVLFILSCHSLAGQSEMRVIEQEVRGAGHEDIFFICNRFDEIRDREKERLVNYGKEKLGPQTSFGDAGVYFISALNALEGKEKHDDALVAESGMIRLECDLTHFLVNERGRIKLLQPARELTIAILDVLLKRIPSQKKMLEEDIERLESRYKEKEPLLRDAERRKTQIVTRLETDAVRLENDVKREAIIWIKDCADQLPKWAETFEPENEIKFLSFTRFSAQAADLAKEVSEHLQRQIEVKQSEWRNSTVKPLLESRLKEMAEDVGQRVEDLLHSVDQIRADLAGVHVDELKSRDVKDISALERVLAAAGGLLIGGLGAAAVGGAMGYMEMLKSLIPQVALGLGMILVGITNPWIIIAGLLGGGAVQGFWKQKSTTSMLKMKVAEEMVKKLKEGAYASGDELAGRVKQMTANLTGAVKQGLEQEINAVREQVQSVLEDKRKGEVVVKQKIAMLEAAHNELNQVREGVLDLECELRPIE